MKTKKMYFLFNTLENKTTKLKQQLEFPLMSLLARMMIKKYLWSGEASSDTFYEAESSPIPAFPVAFSGYAIIKSILKSWQSQYRVRLDSH